MRPISLRATVAITALAGVAPFSAKAQTDASTPGVQPHRRQHICWRGRPAPACDVFWITEFAYEAKIASTRTRYEYAPGYAATFDDLRSRIVWTVGPMVNRPGNRAVGGTLTLGGTSGGLRAALEARHRWWGGSVGALDISAGVARSSLDVPDAYGTAVYGPTVGVLLVGGDLIEVSSRTDLAFGYGRPMAATTLGIGLGSYAAAGGTAAFGALVALLVRAFDNY